MVYELTHSPWNVGLVGFCSQIPTLLLSAVAGVWLDRVDRVKLLLITQSMALLHALVLAFLVAGGHAVFPVLLVMAVVLGIIQAFDLLGRQVLSVMLAEDRRHMPAIVSANSSLVNIGRMAGPSIAGVIIAAGGVSYCFWINAGGCACVILLIALLRFPRHVPRLKKASLWKELDEGFSYVRYHESLQQLMLMSAVTSVFGLAVTLMPSHAREMLHGDGKVLGLLMSSFSAGATVSGFLLACRESIRGLSRTMSTGMLMASAAFYVFAFSTRLPLSMGALFFMGLGLVMVVAPSSTLLQHRVEEAKRGRVMSIYSTVFMGGTPIGALLTGFLAQHLGLIWAAGLNASLCLFSGYLYYERDAANDAETQKEI